MIIHKWRLRLDGADQAINLPDAAKVVLVGLDGLDGQLCIWTLSADPPFRHDRTFRVVGTGEEFGREYTHLGSVIDRGFVWHLLEKNR